MKPNDLERMWRRAEEIAEPRDRRTMRVDDLDRMWAIFQEAAQTSRWFSAPPRLGLPSKSAMPDSPDEISHWQEVMAYLRGEREEMPEMNERNMQPRPDPQQITRCDYVLRLFHNYAMVGRSRKREKMRAVFAYAAGMKASRVREKFGLSKYQLGRVRLQAMEDMCRAVKIRT